MDPELVAIPRGESDINWDDARAYLRRRLAFRLRGVQADELEDLTQEALVRLLRTVRREGARSPEALMSTIAERTRNEFLRRKIRRREHEQSIEDVVSILKDPGGDAASDLESIEDEPGRLAFLILEFVRRIHPAAIPLCEAKMRGVTLDEVARTHGRTPAAVRKEWSRVAQQFREYWRTHPDALESLGLKSGGR